MPDTGRPERTGTSCPSCGRFVGAREACPYCGASIPRRMSLRVFKYGAIVLALAGLAVLWVAATWAQVPLVYVGDIVGTMNWAYVRLEGTVTKLPSYDEETGYLSFWLNDDTGDIMVTAYRTEAQALVDTGKIPMLGDKVSVEGTLKIKEDFASLTVGVPDKVQITRPAPADMRIGDVTSEHEWQRVRVRAVVRQVREPYEGLTIIELRDASGVIDLSVEEAMVNLKGRPPEVKPGQAVDVVAPVSLYKEEPQLALVDPADLRVVDEEIPLAETVTIDKLSTADVDRFVRVQGQVVEVKPLETGVKFTLDDGTGTIVALLWQDVYEGVAGREFLTEGAEVAFQGVVSEYRGELEIVPEQPMDVELVKAGAGATAVSIGSLTAEHVGQTVRVEGQVTEVQPFSKGTKLKVDDGTGRITVTLWQEVYDTIPGRERLAVDVRVSIQGKVSEYEGALEISPQRGTDVAVLTTSSGPTPTPPRTATPVPQVTPTPRATSTPTPTPKPTVQTVALGKLAGLKGQTVTVEAAITKAESFSQGMKFTLSDGTGTAILLLWQDVYDAMPDRSRLGVGVRVRVTGKVEEYEGDLEVIPAKGTDVQVIGGQAIPTPTRAPAVPISGIDASMKGQVVTIDGYITSVYELSGGHMKYTVDDGTGKIILLVWQNVYEAVPDRDKLVKGARVRATGEVDVYEGDLEVIPQIGTDVVLLQ